VLAAADVNLRIGTVRLDKVESCRGLTYAGFAFERDDAPYTCARSA
jgi:hypothetical protein